MVIAVVYGKHIKERTTTQNVVNFLRSIDDKVDYISLPSTFKKDDFSVEQIEFWKKFGYYIFEDIPIFTTKEQFSSWFEKKIKDQELLFEEKYSAVLQKYRVVVNLHASCCFVNPDFINSGSDSLNQGYLFFYNKKDPVMSSTFQPLPLLSDFISFKEAEFSPDYHHYDKTSMLIECFTNYPPQFYHRMKRVLRFNKISTELACYVPSDEALKEVLIGKDIEFLDDILGLREMRAKEGAVVTYSVVLNPMEIKLGIK
jgi:hypothetical protein